MVQQDLKETQVLRVPQEQMVQMVQQDLKETQVLRVHKDSGNPRT